MIIHTKTINWRETIDTVRYSNFQFCTKKNTSDGGTIGYGEWVIIALRMHMKSFEDVYEAASILVKDKKTFYPDKQRHLRYEKI